MSQSTSSARQRLIEVLGSIALYNDKGHIWSRHTSERIAEEQQKAHTSIQSLVHEIGEQQFASELLAALQSHRPVQDCTGTFKEQVQQCFRER